MRTLSLALLVALAQAADPLFPILPEAFNTTELFWQPASAAGAPMAKVCCSFPFILVFIIERYKVGGLLEPK
jgi:hypothetical protein